MDRRVLVGLAVVILIGAGAISMMNRPQVPGPSDDGVEHPPDGGETRDGEELAIITGTIKVDSGEPLEGVTVKAGTCITTTASDGSYEIVIELGSYVVEASKTDYTKGVKSMSISENVTYTADFTLRYTPPVTGEGKTIKIITRHGADILKTARDSFLESDYAKDNQITWINWIPIGPTLWIDAIRNSGDIDIGWGGGPVLFDVVNEAGFLAPLTNQEILDTLEEIPDEMGGVPTRRVIGDEIYWSGSAVASFGFTINTQVLSDLGLPEPASWSDLASEIYAVELPNPVVGTADATKSTSNTRMFTIILQAYGWQDGWNLLIRMGANSRIYDQSGLVRDAAIQGTIGVGTTIDFYGYTAQLKNPEFCKYVLPADGTIVNADPIALLTTSPDAEVAQAFIAWLLTPEGQKIWLDKNINRLPMNPLVFDTPEGLERADLKEVYETTANAMIIAFSDELALSYEAAMINFYHAVIVRPQLMLVDVWMGMTIALEEGDITRTEFDDLVAMLGDPHLFEFEDPETGETATFTQEYAQSIASRIAIDPEYKTILVDRWIVAAENHYGDVMTELNNLIG